MNVAGSDGKTTTVAPGDAISDFERWPYVCQKAMLRLGRVEKLGAKEAGNLTTVGGYLHFEEKAKAAPVAALSLPVEAVVKPKGNVGCPLCPRDFESEQGLKRHVRKAHKDAP